MRLTKWVSKISNLVKIPNPEPTPSVLKNGLTTKSGFQHCTLDIVVEAPHLLEKDNVVVPIGKPKGNFWGSFFSFSLGLARNQVSKTPQHENVVRRHC